MRIGRSLSFELQAHSVTFGSVKANQGRRGYRSSTYQQENQKKVPNLEVIQPPVVFVSLGSRCIDEI